MGVSHEDPQGRGDALVTLAAASRYLDEAVRDLRQEELEFRTPCADWRLGELLSHVNQSLMSSASRSCPDGGPSPESNRQLGRWSSRSTPASSGPSGLRSRPAQAPPS